MTIHAQLHRWDELPLEKVTEMVARKVIAGAETTVTQAYFKKGTLVPLHTHDVEVFVYVLQGAVRVHSGETEVIVREGDVLVVPSAIPHQAESLDDTFMLTVTPRRPKPALTPPVL